MSDESSSTPTVSPNACPGCQNESLSQQNHTSVCLRLTEHTMENLQKQIEEINKEIGEIKLLLKAKLKTRKTLMKKVTVKEMKISKDRAIDVKVDGCLFRDILLRRDNWDIKHISEKHSVMCRQVFGCQNGSCYITTREPDRIDELYCMYHFKSLDEKLHFILCNGCMDSYMNGIIDELISEWGDGSEGLTTVKVDPFKLSINHNVKHQKWCCCFDDD